MFSMTERFTEAQKANRANLDAQLSMFNSLAATTLNGVEKIMALHLALAKASFDTSASTAQQLCAASTPQEFLMLAAQARPNFDTFQAYGRDLANLSRNTQQEFIQATQIPAQQTVIRSAGHSASAATPAATADAPTKQLTRSIAASVTPEVTATDTRKLHASSAAPEQVPAQAMVMEAAVAPAGPASTSKKLASKAIHAKQEEEAAAGRTAAAAQAAKLPARSNQPRLQSRKIPGKK